MGHRTFPRSARLTLGAALLTATTGLGGCLWSRLDRRTIDVEPFSAWAGQSGTPADSLLPALVSVTSRVPEVRDGSLQGIEEVALFAQIQNAGLSAVAVSIYAHPQRLADPASVRRDGVRLLVPTLVDARSALQVDARNYPALAEGLEAVAELARDGDFYLYVLGEGTHFRVSANVPTITFLVTID